MDGTRRRLIHGSFSIFVNNASMIGRMVLGTSIGIEVSELSMRLFEDKLLLCRLLSPIPLHGQTDAIRNSLLTTIPVIECI